MTSKLIVNSLAADTGVSTITFADQAKMGNSIFHSTGFTIGDSFLHSTGVNLTNINATGVITATKFVGEVSVGSSITFEDNEKAYFGTGTDFSIYHNGSASYLDETGTGGLIAKTNTAFQVFNSAGSQPAFTVTPGGSVDLYHNTSKVLETKAYGIDITGGFVATGDCSIADKITHAGDLNTAIRFPAADQISFETGGTNRLKLHYYASNHHVELDSSTHLSLADNGSNGRFIYMGDANASSTGYMHLQPGPGSQGMGGGIRLYSHANSTNAGGVYIGKSLNSSGAIIFGNGGMTPSTEYLRITSDGNITFGVTNTSTAITSAAIKYISGGRDYWNGTKGDYRALRLRVYDNGGNIDDQYGIGVSSGELEIQSQGDIGFYAATAGSNTGRRALRFKLDYSEGSLDFETNTKLYLKGTVNNPQRHASINIGSNSSNGETRAIDVWGSWGAGENKSITFNHGSSTSEIVGQINCIHTSPGSSMRWGKLYHAGNSSTYTLTLDSYSTTGADLNIVNGNLKVASGHGIDFSATSNAGNSASMSNELLDDYEEGSWTPHLVSSAANMSTTSFSFHQGTYTKIGRLVYITGVMYGPRSSGGTGNLRISNLPYTVRNGDHAQLLTKDYQFSNYPSNFGHISGYGMNNGTQIQLFKREGSSQAGLPLSWWSTSANDYMYFNLTYTTDT